MKRPLLLDLFCGAGGCAVGYHRAGFDVVGVDIKPQPRYPFEFQEGDALEAIDCLIRGGYLRPGESGSPLYLEDFAAIHASPPCQAYSVTKSLSKKTHPDIVEATRRLCQKTGKPWVIENVIGSPLGTHVLLCGTMFGLKVLRHRLFEASFLIMIPPHPKHPKGNLTDSCRRYSTGESGFVCVAGHSFSRVAGAKAMGIDWPTTRAELAQAIPPAYTEFIGKQLLNAIQGAKP